MLGHLQSLVTILKNGISYSLAIFFFKMSFGRGFFPKNVFLWVGTSRNLHSITALLNIVLSYNHTTFVLGSCRMVTLFDGVIFPTKHSNVSIERTTLHFWPTVFNLWNRNWLSLSKNNKSHTRKYLWFTHLWFFIVGWPFRFRLNHHWIVILVNVGS